MLAIIKSPFPLPDGAVLKTSDLQWRVKGRVFYQHINYALQVAQERKFVLYPRYSSIEEKLAAEQKLEQQENEGIFHYLIDPIGHEQKPSGKVEIE